MPRFEQQLNYRTGNPPALLDRLIGVRIRAHGYRPALITRASESCVEQLCRAGLHEQPGFEIHAWREVMIGVCRARKAIDAAMLAAPISIHGSVKADIGRIIAR